MALDWKTDFVIGTDANSDVSILTIVSVQRLLAKGYKFLWDIRGVSGAARTKSIIATRFLQQKLAPYLIWIDRDIVFTPQDLEYLLEDLKNGYQSVGGCYAVRNGQQLASYGLGDGSINLDGTVREIKYLSTGFSAVTYDLLERLVKELDLPLLNAGQPVEMYPFFEECSFKDPDAGWMWLSEDYYFNVLTRRIGVKPYLDTRIWLGHIGSTMYEVGHAIYHSNRDKVALKVKEELETLAQQSAPKAS